MKIKGLTELIYKVPAVLFLTCLAIISSTNFAIAAEKSLERPQYEDAIIVEVRHDRGGRSAIVDAILDDERLFLNLPDFFTTFGYQPDVTADMLFRVILTGSRGMLELDMETGEFSSDQLEGILDEQHFIPSPQGPYVETGRLAEITGFEFEFNLEQVSVTVSSRELMAYEIQRQRQDQRQRLTEDATPIDQTIREQVPYRVMDVPFVDASVTSTVRNQAPNTTAEVYDIRYDARGSGDALFMSSEWFLTGSERDGLQLARIKAGRRSMEPNLLGPLGATSFYVGDLNSPRLQGVSLGRTGRGAEISNYPLMRTGEFTSTDVRGTTQPGWEVELYRGNNLIDFINADAGTGEYVFEDVQLNYGHNNFRVLKIGPLGQQEERRVAHYIGPQMIQPGRLYYRASAVQHNTDLIEVRDRRFVSPMDEQPRLFLELEQGITRSLSAGAWSYSLPLLDGQHTYIGGGLRAAFNNFMLRGDFIKDLESGYALQGAMQSRVGTWNLTLDHTQMFDDYVSEVTFGLTRNYSSISRVNLSGNLPGRFFTSFQVQDERFDGDRYFTRFQHQLARSLGRWYVSNWLFLNFRDNIEGIQYGRGRLNIRRRMGWFVPRGELTYTIRPLTEINEVMAGGEIYASQRFSMNFRGGYQFQRLDRAFASVGMNHSFGPLSAGLSLYGTTDNQYFAGVSIFSSFSRNPLSGRPVISSRPISSTAGIAGQIYTPDSNPGRVPLEDVQVQVSPAVEPFVSDADGKFFKTGLLGWRNNTVNVNDNTLIDPLMASENPPTTFFSRPGRVIVLDFPVIYSSEIEGYVKIEDRGELIPRARVPLQLRDADGNLLDEESSVFDGFYLFQTVFQGDYTIAVAEDYLSRFDLVAEPEIVELEVLGDGSILAHNFVLRAPETDEPDPDEDEEDISRIDRLIAEWEGYPCTLGDDFPPVLFNFDEDRLTEAGRELVRQQAEVMHEFQRLTVFIEGFADSVGNARYNLGLSQRRANAVRDELIANGILRDRILTIARGEVHEPCDSDVEDDPGCREQRKAVTMRYSMFDAVYFGFDESSLTEESLERLANNVGLLKACPDIDVRVEAYTDQAGSRDYNVQLSERRAEAVTLFYIQQGISPSRIDVVYGGQYPIGSIEGQHRPPSRQRVAFSVDGYAPLRDAMLEEFRRRLEYVVQLASFRTVEPAEQYMRQLASDFDLNLTIRYKPEQQVYAITTRETYGYLNALRKVDELRSLTGKQDLFILVTPPEFEREKEYFVQIGLFMNRWMADRLRSEISADIGHPLEMEYFRSRDMYRIRVRGRFEGDEAKEILEQVRQVYPDATLIEHEF